MGCLPKQASDPSVAGAGKCIRMRFASLSRLPLRDSRELGVLGTSEVGPPDVHAAGRLLSALARARFLRNKRRSRGRAECHEQVVSCRPRINRLGGCRGMHSPRSCHGRDSKGMLSPPRMQGRATRSVAVGRSSLWAFALVFSRARCELPPDDRRQKGKRQRAGCLSIPVAEQRECELPPLLPKPWAGLPVLGSLPAPQALLGTFGAIQKYRPAQRVASEAHANMCSGILGRGPCVELLLVPPGALAQRCYGLSRLFPLGWRRALCYGERVR